MCWTKGSRNSRQRLLRENRVLLLVFYWAPLLDWVVEFCCFDLCSPDIFAVGGGGRRAISASFLERVYFFPF